MSEFRDISRSRYTSVSGATAEAINTGSLQRIADATETMAQNFILLQNERDRYKKWYEEERSKVSKLYKRISALKGVITRMKTI